MGQKYKNELKSNSVFCIFSDPESDFKPNQYEYSILSTIGFAIEFVLMMVLDVVIG